MQAIDVAWADQAKVAPIEGGELGFVQAFRDGCDGRVNEADVRMGVPVAELTDSSVVVRLQLFDSVSTGDDVIE